MLLQTSFLHSFEFSAEAMMHFFVFSSDLFARTGWEVSGDKSEVWTV
jgi:hypothetical protein